MTDYGQTLRFGRYEAATEAVLYEYDPDYRRHLKARRRAEDTGFGPSLRRLRKQRGLRRSDFAPLSAKTIARLERGEVEKPHGDTLAIIAKKLRVKPDEIEMY
ncbi:MAG: helix-turn-helix transcriptional regulator [Phycisphaerae bacterium]|nr:helix-turn-helix transcriptional regulator [Phycisphaerae bacterium]